MKSKIILLGMVALLAMSCEKKTETETGADAPTERADAGDMTAGMSYTNEAGEKIQITYFADGDLAGVKLKKGNEAEKTLKAVLDNPSNNAAFSDGKVTWEVTEENSGGNYTDETGKTVKYKRD